ncbi:MAG: GntR family transcriptional regulator [Actinobacteria bacterium]|nr:GntR family transcriptional regulator [Actinomycetota bacterium]
MIKRENPLYIKVRDHIAEMITAGKLEPGQKLPSEHVLSDDLMISRTTLRDALKMLEESGLVKKEHGVGTFVRSTNIVRNSLEFNHSITQMIASMGMKPGTINEKVYEDKSDSYISEKLLVSEGSPVIVVERIRTADGDPIVFSREYIPKNIVNCDISADEIGESLSLFLSERCNQLIAWTFTKIFPVIATKELSDVLGVQKGSCMIMMEQIDINLKDAPICFGFEYFNQTKFEFTILRKWKS